MYCFLSVVVDLLSSFPIYSSTRRGSQDIIRRVYILRGFRRKLLFRNEQLQSLIIMTGSMYSKIIFFLAVPSSKRLLKQLPRAWKVILSLQGSVNLEEDWFLEESEQPDKLEI